MPAEEAIDELVDKAINEALSRSDKDSEEVKKRRPKPFRYLTEKEEIKAELGPDVPTPISVMKESPAARIVDEKLAILGIGDIETIENVIKRHEASKKFREK